MDNSQYIKEANNNANIIKEALSDLESIEVNSAQSFSVYKESTSKILELFKNLKPLSKDDRENLWKKFQQILELNKKRQEEHRAQRNKMIEDSKNNAQTIEHALNELESIEINSSEKFDFYRDKNKLVINLFKNLKPLLKEDRNSLWERFQRISDKKNEIQEKIRRNRLNASSQKKDAVLSTLREARNYCTLNIEDLRKAEDLLKLAEERMQPGWRSGFNVATDMFTLNDGKMTREDLDECYKLRNEIKQIIKYKKDDLRKQNEGVINSDLTWIADLAYYKDPYEALKQINTLRQKIFSAFLPKDRKEYFVQSLTQYREYASSRIQKQKEEKNREIEQKKQDYLNRQAEKARKQSEWEERQRERDRRQIEYQNRQAEKARKQSEWEERQRDREQKKREHDARQRDWEQRRSTNNRNRNKGGGCYITTATCLALDKPDNCCELTAIRYFRDSWLQYQENGCEIIDDYYKVAPLIVDEINKKNNSNSIYKSIWEDFLQKFFELIVQEKHQEAKTVYLNMVENLKMKFL